MPSNINTNVLMVYGGSTSGVQVAPQSGIQNTPENVTTTTRRVIRGPKGYRGLSIDLRCDSSAGVTSATGFTLWYSNMPEPDATSDADWHQDTSIGTSGLMLALTTTGKAFFDLADRRAVWFMIKADVTAGAAGVRVFVNCDGVEI